VTIDILLSPAGHGKTARVVAAVRAAPPLSPVRVLVPDQIAATAFRLRLAQAGGALGVEVQTFYGLYADVLAFAVGLADPRQTESNGGMARLSPTVRHRLIQHLAEHLSDANVLPYYAPLCRGQKYGPFYSSGFVRMLGELFGELKRARIFPENLEPALAVREPRLAELARLYAAYQSWLLDTGWVDADGQGWLAAIALETQPGLLSDLALLAVDGFDEFNPTQLHLLRLLAHRAAATIVTLTGDAENPDRPAHRRFARARAALVRALGVEAGGWQLEMCPTSNCQPPASSGWEGTGGEIARPAPLAHLERRLFEPTTSRASAGDAITFLEAQNRGAEARAALRWLKARLVRDGTPPDEVAVVARDVARYRPFLEEAAAEFGLPLRFASGAELRANPAIAALLNLLALPLEPVDWAPRALADALTSPYFDWSLLGEHGGVLAGPLYDVARAGQVMVGLDQWRAAFRSLASRAAGEADGPAPASLDEEEFAPRRPPAGSDAAALGDMFEAIVARVTPPPGATLRERVMWLEELIGADPERWLPGEAGQGEPVARSTGHSISSPGDETSLRVVARSTESAVTADRDIAALRAFKDILRGLVLAGAVLDAEPGALLPQGQFVAELTHAVEGATYTIPVQGEAILIASALEVRGLTFDAVALLGLAEGDFPQAEIEDTLLRDADRIWLAERGFAIEPSLHGDEATFFYQAITRARRRLLLCRPYLADDGQPWEASSYWSAARELFEDAPLLHVRPVDPVSDPASSQEYAAVVPGNLLAIPAAILRARAGAGPAPWNGDLSALADELAWRYGAHQPWSSSRLETYAKCPFYFWAAYALELEPHEEPQAGFDVLILGSIYHGVLERLYTRVPDGDPDRLRAELPAVARQVFEAAPNEYGFRPTPLWEHQQQELTDVLRRTLNALIEAAEGYVPLVQELPFGLQGRPPLVLRGEGAEVLQLRGYIDRVDRGPDGRLRIIDYKAGSTAIAARDLANGRRLQLPLYALAAREALGAIVAGGFYWHIGAAKPSSLTLEKFEGGVAGAIETAVAHAVAIGAAVRGGQFAPQPPAEGCPASCPATAFCERYKTRSW
jgi:ATP-dependent helicase/DNAse subunit B